MSSIPLIKALGEKRKFHVLGQKMYQVSLEHILSYLMTRRPKRPKIPHQKTKEPINLKRTPLSRKGKLSFKVLLHTY